MADNVRALVVAVAAKASAQGNLEVGLETGTWGFPKNRDWYGEVQAGDLVLLGTGLDHPSGNRNPRKQLESYRRGTLGRVVVAQALGGVSPFENPHWPDEVAVGQVLYPFRLPILPMFVVLDVRLELLSEALVDGFRRSGIIQGAGIVVESPPTDLSILGGLADVDPDPANLFGSTPGVDPSEGSLSRLRARSRAGRSNDPERNSIVEKWAEKRATELYAPGWKVELVGKPYDLRCTRGSEERHVEVKGTTGLGAKVVLTPNEVEHARQFPTDLVVVSEIHLSLTSKGLRPSGGRVRQWVDWRPARKMLRPSQYEYEVPPGG